MGNQNSSSELTAATTIPENPNRKVFIEYVSHLTQPNGLFSSYVEYEFKIYYYRWSFDISCRFTDLLTLEIGLQKKYPKEMTPITRLANHGQSKLFVPHNSTFLTQRAQIITKFLQSVLDLEVWMPYKASHPEIGELKGILFDPMVYRFLKTSITSFLPEYGRKRKEGYLKKCSGGYHEGFSGKVGDYISLWRKRWVSLHDTCLIWYPSPDSTEISGVLQIRPYDFEISQVGRVITIATETRKLSFFAASLRLAEEWILELRKLVSWLQEREAAIDHTVAVMARERQSSHSQSGSRRPSLQPGQGLSERAPSIEGNRNISTTTKRRPSLPTPFVKTPFPFEATFPARMKNDFRFYLTSSEYFSELAFALLSAQKEILITSWKMNPNMMLIRPNASSSSSFGSSCGKMLSLNSSVFLCWFTALSCRSSFVCLLIFLPAALHCTFPVSTLTLLLLLHLTLLSLFLYCCLRLLLLFLHLLSCFFCFFLSVSFLSLAIRLDQLLKYKAEQGIKIYILLYKEAKYVGQGNDSRNVMKKLENLSSNIHVIRHPNKFIGGSTTLLWSHNEKMVVIDRLIEICFSFLIASSTFSFALLFVAPPISCFFLFTSFLATLSFLFLFSSEIWPLLVVLI
jgi:hypothetical protein